MTRSALAQQRRRTLADAATDQFPAPISVVLYLRAATAIAAKAAMTRLIAHAQARHWVIIGSITEVPHALSVTGRSGWDRVQDLVSSGQCTGVIAAIDPAMAEDAGAWGEEAHSWLKVYGAFLTVPRDTQAAKR